MLLRRYNDEMSQRRFVILDRDGTLNELGNPYITEVAQFVLLPGATDGLRELHLLGLGLVLVTNQSAVGRGFLELTRLDEIHQRMEELLAAESIRLDGVYFCPHAPEAECLCRKPRTALVESASRELGFNPAHAFVIGDDYKDIALGHAVGATTFFVRTGRVDTLAEADHAAPPQYVVEDLRAAAAVIRKLVTSAEGMRSFEP